MNKPPILLLDVMSTLVYDPFLVELPAFFQMSFKTLIKDKDPTAWPRFERGELTEEAFWQTFFKDKRTVDIEGVRNALLDAYDFVDGMAPLLEQYHKMGIPMYTMTNYPVWWQMIEQKLQLSRWVEWRFISCQMGVRKPDAQIYTMAANELGVAPERCVFVDDRESNCQGARDVGMRAIKFSAASTLDADFQNLHDWPKHQDV